MIKNIFICWFQGFDNAPEIVKNCLKSWYHYNPDWNIIQIDDNSLKKYINLSNHIDISKKNISMAHLSDIIRVLLLNKHGGVWVDATTFCNKPLNNWLPQNIKEGFFAFNKPGPDRMISNWFLYANKQNHIINKWKNATLNYYKKHDKANTYFIHHYLFERLYNNNEQFKKIWNSVPKLSANKIHYLYGKGFFSKNNDEVKNDINSKIIPLYKITYKCDFAREYNSKTNLYYLFSTI